MTDVVERLLKIAEASRRDDGTLIPLGMEITEAADEITRLRQLLSEAEKRDREARANALEEAATIVDGVSHEGLHNSMWRYRFERVAADIRALQSEER